MQAPCYWGINVGDVIVTCIKGVCRYLAQHGIEGIVCIEAKG